MQDDQDIFKTIREFKQDHLIDHYHSIETADVRAAFLKQLEAVDYRQAAQLYQHVYLDK